MLRLNIPYFLIAVLLGCPYCCLAEETADAAEKSLSAGCSCCYRPSDTDRKSPQTPVGGQHDCLCQGAVLDSSKVESLDSPFDLFVFASCVLNANVTGITQLSDIGNSSACHFPPTAQGRELYALICALLL